MKDNVSPWGLQGHYYFCSTSKSPFFIKDRVGAKLIFLLFIVIFTPTFYSRVSFWLSLRVTLNFSFASMQNRSSTEEKYSVKLVRRAHSYTPNHTMRRDYSMNNTGQRMFWQRLEDLRPQVDSAQTECGD